MSLRIVCVRVPRRPTVERAPADWARLAASLLEAAPRVSAIRGAAEGEPRGYWADATGMERRGGDAAVAQALLAAARGAGYEGARVGVAGTCVAAALATRERGSAWRVVPPGRDASFVARRPLSLLPMEEGVRESLELLGLRRCAELAALATADVELRFGPEGVRVWRLARGEDPRWPFRPPPAAGVAAEAELDAPVETLEPLRFLLRGLLGSVLEQMARRQRVPAALRLVLRLDDGDEEALDVRPARPTGEARLLSDLCHRALEGHAAAGAILGVRLEGVEEGAARADQLDIFRPPAPDPAAVHASLLPLLQHWGDGALSRASLKGAHLPAERVRWEERGVRGVLDVAGRPAAPPEDGVRTPSRAELPLCLRRFPEPRPAAVQADAAGRPTALRLPGASAPARVRAEGPERLSGRWWAQGYAREYWLAETEAGTLWLLFRDGREGRWYLEGWYD